MRDDLGAASGLQPSNGFYMVSAIRRNAKRFFIKGSDSFMKKRFVLVSPESAHYEL